MITGAEIIQFVGGTLVAGFAIVGISFSGVFLYRAGERKRKGIERRAGVLDQVDAQEKQEQKTAEEAHKALKAIGRD